MSQALDRMLIWEGISRYFFAMDALSDADAILACFTDDASWACYDHGCDEPSLAFDSRDDLDAVVRLQAAQAGDVQLKHHLTGLVFDGIDEARAVTRAKVLVTQQRPGDPAPRPRNTAECEGTWRRTGDGWRLQRWVVRRGPAGDADVA
ncbi:MAG: nuclear transport factor 2 family protein [Myxococcota bacterium]